MNSALAGASKVAWEGHGAETLSPPRAPFKLTNDPAEF